MRTNIVRLWVLLLVATSLFAQTVVKRPHIVGISHVAVYVKDLKRARAFYKGFLGFEEPYSLKRPDGSEHIAFIKVNDQQSLELFAEDPHDDGQFSHLAFYTDNAEQMRNYLLARGVTVPDPVHRGQTGDLFFTVKDPDGHLVEIIESRPDGLVAKNRGRSMPPGRAATRIAHVGILTGSLGPALRFYHDILGFSEFWRGSSRDGQLHWTALRVPDGEDSLELMLYQTLPPKDKRGLQNHIGLETSNLAKDADELKSRAARSRYSYPIEVRTGKDHRLETDLWDPDGTRVEIREAAHSTAPVPAPATNPKGQ